MKIEITKEEFREIIRMYLIGMLAESSMIKDEDRRENEEKREKDNHNLFFKLLSDAEKKGINFNFVDKVMKELQEDFVKAMKTLIEERKRTYTSKYWNFTGD